MVLFSNFYFLSCLSEGFFVCLGCASVCRAQTQRHSVNNLFSSVLCWAPTSQAFQGDSSPFPSLTIIKPRLRGWEGSPQQGSNAQIKTSTGWSPQPLLRHYHGSQLEIMLRFIEMGLSKLFRNTSTFVEQGKVWLYFLAACLLWRYFSS